MPRLLCLLLPFCLLAPALHAQTIVTLTPTYFSRIFSDYPDNRNNDVITSHWNGANGIQHSFLAFNLSDLVDANVTVQSASLTLTFNSSFQLQSDTPTNIYRIGTSYVAGAESWNSNGSTGWTNLGGDFLGTTGSNLTTPFASYSGNISGFGFDGQTITFDVMSLVSGWVDGTYTNDGFGIAREPTSAQGSLEFYGAGANQPTLSITYAASAVPEPSTYALLSGFGVLGLAWWTRRRRSLSAPESPAQLAP